MSMWYLPDKDKCPAIVELDFDCNTQENPESNQTSLEEYPLSVIRNVNNLYSSLQRESIVESCRLKDEDRVCVRINHLIIII